MSREIDRFLDRARRRHRRVEAVGCGGIGLAAGAALAVVLRLASLSLPWGVAAVVAGPLLALATMRRPDDLTLAARLDRAAGLGSALTAAVEFLHRRDPWATAQRRAAVPLLTHLDLATLLPWRGHAWGVAAAALLAMVLFLPAVRPTREQPPVPARITASAEVVRPTGAHPAPSVQHRGPSNPPAVAALRDGAAGNAAPMGNPAGATVPAPRRGGAGGGRGAGLGDAAATGPLLADQARPEAAAIGATVAVATRGRGLLPAPTGGPPSPVPGAAGHLTPDAIANLPLHRRAAVAHYFALLHPIPGATP